MSVIDLDKRIKVDNQVTIKLAGKEYSLVFDDNFAKLVSKTYIQVMNAFKGLESSDYADQNIQKQSEEAEQAINKTKDVSIKAIDKLLGKGEGKRLYNYYNHTTSALAAVLSSLQGLAQNSVEVKADKKPVIKHAKSN